jgi:RNA polymerase sigma factor (sigma-70 family)
MSRRVCEQEIVTASVIDPEPLLPPDSNVVMRSDPDSKAEALGELTGSRATPPAVAGEAADPLLPLVRRAARGEREALASLLSLIGPSIVAAVRVVTGAEVDVEDAAQEAMIAIADSVERFRGQSTFLHYARRIAVRTALAQRRARRAKSRPLVDLDAQPNMGDAAEPSAGPNAEVERGEWLAVFQGLLDELPEGQAESLTYRVLFEYPLPVIARELQVPVNTVRSRIRLARDHLRQRILSDPELLALMRGPR